MLAALSPTSAATTLRNSIVSGNTDNGAQQTSSCLLRSVRTSLVYADNSAIGGPYGFSMKGANNLPFGADLKLSPLANHGGPTPTIAPLPGSPLINAGSDALLPADIITDQRGGTFSAASAECRHWRCEFSRPSLSTALATTQTVTTAGATTYSFTVTFSDLLSADPGLNVTSIIGNNSAVEVVGPNGFVAPATFISISDPTDGTPRTVTYAITPPGGSWDLSDLGDYSILIVGNQVTNLDGDSVQAGTIGVFSVTISKRS